MALQAKGKETVRILGWTEPRPYEAGSFNGNAFPAGQSMRVCVGLEEHGFQVLKVKNEDVPAVFGAISQPGFKPGVVCEIEFAPATGDSLGRLFTVVVKSPAVVR